MSTAGERTQFKPGNNGGPGRPRDNGKLMRKRFAPFIPQLLDQHLAAALNGDISATDTVIRVYFGVPE